MTKVEHNAFSDCSSLTSITILNPATEFDSFVFARTGLTSVTIPDSMTSISPGQFCMCLKLKNISIPDSVTSIGDGTFYYCKSLTSITIPDSVTSIGYGAFNECTDLTIYGYDKSYAQTYANEKGIPFVIIEKKPEPAPTPAAYGDMDGDGVITSGDALNVLRASVDLSHLTPEQFRLADIDGDGTLTSSDALSVLRSSAGLPSDSKIGKSA